jgi:hypothetical protein
MFEGVQWFAKEALEHLVGCTEALAELSGTQPRAAKTRAARVLKAAMESGYRWDTFTAALQKPSRRAPSGTRRHRPTP